MIAATGVRLNSIRSFSALLDIALSDGVEVRCCAVGLSLAELLTLTLWPNFDIKFCTLDSPVLLGPFACVLRPLASRLEPIVCVLVCEPGWWLLTSVVDSVDDDISVTDVLALDRADDTLLTPLIIVRAAVVGVAVVGVAPDDD